MSERPTNGREATQQEALLKVQLNFKMSIAFAVLAPFIVPVTLYYYTKAKLVAEDPVRVNDTLVSVALVMSLMFVVLLLGTAFGYLPGVIGAIILILVYK